MLNEEKIILMTKLAIYEKGEGKKEIPMSRYYRNDYVGVHMLYTFLSVTAGYVLLFALYIARDVEDFLSSLTTMDLKKFLFTAVAIYICAELFFLFVAWVVYRRRFKKNRQHLNEYFGDLKKLKKIQKREQAKAMKMVEGKENEPAGGFREDDSFEEDAYDDISPFEDEDGGKPFKDEDAEDGGDPFAWDTEDDAEPSGDPFVTDDDTNSPEGRDGDPFAWDIEDKTEPFRDRFALEDEADDVIPVQENGQSMDPNPEAEVEQALRKIMAGGREDDEEDEDGFTFSS